jgi:uncharacterized protein (DUF488 family)
MSPAEIYTIGHSTHSIGGFVALLKAHAIGCVADVRTAPKSRRLPHFDGSALVDALGSRGIAYEHLRELGGWRRPRPDSPNTGWSVRGFQGYADHMRSAAFRTALARLEVIAHHRRTAIMCAEAQWWRCHRRLIADALRVSGWHVIHIAADGGASEHELTTFARVDDAGDITYPPRQESLELP